jgi:ribonuclease P protein component
MIKKNKLTKFLYKECIFIKKNAFFFYSDPIIFIKKSILFDSTMTHANFLIIISKKIGNAVVRNYTRRIIKEIIFNDQLYKNIFTYVFIMKKACTFEEMKKSLSNAFKEKSPL